jgi:hypothetical protein
VSNASKDWVSGVRAAHAAGKAESLPKSEFLSLAEAIFCQISYFRVRLVREAALDNSPRPGTRMAESREAG